MKTSSNFVTIDSLKAWAFFWVLSTVGGIIAGAIGGAILGGLLGGLGVHMRTIKLVCGGFGFLLGIPVSFLFFHLSIYTFVLPKTPADATEVKPGV